MTTNIDSQEIAKFEALADEWWNPQGKLKTLHDINPIRLNFIQKYVDLADKRILDVGCGGGILTEALVQQGAKLTGIDLSTSAIEIARAHSHISGLSIDYRCLSVEELATQQASQYDIVTCMELLEHVPSPESIVHACATLAKPGATLIFSSINRNIKAYLQAILGAEYLLQLLPKGTHDYAKFIRPSELDEFAQTAGLTLTAMAGIGYRLSEKTYYLTDNVSVNYMALFTK